MSTKHTVPVNAPDYVPQMLRKLQDSKAPKAKPMLRRRLSLAEELAMVGEGSESGYQTSEMASSANEESDFESGNESHDMSGRGYESEGYSVNGESIDERSTTDSDDGRDSGENTIDVLDVMGCQIGALSNGDRSQSRLPRLKQPLIQSSVY